LDRRLKPEGHPLCFNIRYFLGWPPTAVAPALTVPAVPR
jgi:hypothetical protein